MASFPSTPPPLPGPNRLADAPSTVVKCWGIPWRAQKRDVVNFFNPLQTDVTRVQMLTGPDGRPTGESLVRFSTIEDAEQALSFNGLKFPESERWVSVSALSEELYTQKILSQPVKDASTGILRLRGLPFRTSAFEVAAFLAEYGITKECIVLGMNKEDLPSGIAWVTFPDPRQAELCLEQKNGAMMGHRYIDVFPSMAEEIGSVSNKLSFKGKGKEGKDGKGKGDGKCFQAPPEPPKPQFRAVPIKGPTDGNAPNPEWKQQLLDENQLQEQRYQQQMEQHQQQMQRYEMEQRDQQRYQQQQQPGSFGSQDSSGGAYGCSGTSATIARAAASLDGTSGPGRLAAAMAASGQAQAASGQAQAYGKGGWSQPQERGGPYAVQGEQQRLMQF